MSTGSKDNGLSATDKSLMTDITSLPDTQVLMLLHAQDIWPDFIQILSKPDGFMVQSKLKTLVISFITELFTDSETKHGKELLELLTVLRTLILLFHGIELDT